MLGAEVLFTLQDSRIAESSSLVSTPSGDWLWTLNDSGDAARLFAVDPSGATRTVATLPDTDLRDVEDAAYGPGRTLYLADIGDNRSRRTSVSILRVPEPPTDRARVTTGPPVRTELTYEDGPHDAETLLVSPVTGQVLVVTKGLLGSSVYAAPRPLADGVLRKVGTVPLRRTGTSGGPVIGVVAQVLATGGAVSPDGRRLVVRTYTDAYVYAVPGDDLAAAFAGEPEVVALPASQQGEAVTFTPDGSALLTSTEGVGTPVHRVPLAAPGPDSTTPSPTPTTPAPTSAPTSAPEPGAADPPGGGSGRTATLAALLVAAAGVLLLRRRR